MKYARAYTYDTSDPSYHNAKGEAIQDTDQWVHLVALLWKLGIEVRY